MFHGVGLQLLLYMFALQECGGDVVGEKPIPAGVMYFPARVPFVTADGRLSPEELQKQRMKDMKRKGLLLSDQEVLQAMEPADDPIRLSYSTKKDGTLTTPANTTLGTLDKVDLGSETVYLDDITGQLKLRATFDFNPYTGKVKLRQIKYLD